MSELIQLYWIVALFFALLVAVFALQNAEAVDIRFLAWQFKDISLVLVIFGSAVIGALFLFLVSTIKQLTMVLKMRDAEGKIRKLEKELTHLKEEHVKEADEQGEEEKTEPLPQENGNSIDLN